MDGPLKPLEEAKLERDQCPEELVKDMKGLIGYVTLVPRLFNRT